MIIKVYHGSDSLPRGQVPDASHSEPAFVTPHRKFATEFGKVVHEFKIEGDLLLDLRRPEHQTCAMVLIESDRSLQGGWLSKSLQGDTRSLPVAYGRFYLQGNDPELTTLRDLKLVAIQLGFKGCIQSEEDWDGSPESFEIYDSSILTPSEEG